MPRETINKGDLTTQIVWRRGLYAQIGVVSDKPVRAIKDTHGTYSLWSDLDAAGVDRLMKVLRRVKRQLELEPDDDADGAYVPVAVPDGKTVVFTDGKVPVHD